MSETPTLYLYPAADDLPSFSPPCAKVALALAYAQLPHTVRPVRGDPGRHSPTGRLPVLVVGGERLTDSVQILDRVEELAPPRPFWPADPQARVQDRLWEHFVNDTLYWPGLFERWLVPENRRRLLDHLFGRGLKRRLLGPLVSRRVRQRAVGQGVGLKSIPAAREAFLRGVTLADAALDPGPFLDGRTTPGRGDFALAALIAQASYQGITPWTDDQLRRFPRLLEHARQVFQAAERPVPAGLRAVTPAGASGG